MALTLTACGGSGDNAADGGNGSDDQVVIKVSTFNNFGFGAPTAQKPGADLWKKYEALHPNVKIEETVAAKSDDARAAFNTAIATGSGAFDIQAVDVDWMPSIMAQPDKFVDLTDYVKDNDWLDWKTQGATTDDGKLVGAGTDIGPEGICFRSDLLAAAGLPSDRDALKEALGGADATWDKYFELGAQYVQKSGGKAWFDSSAAVFQGMVNQIEESHVSKDGEIIAGTDAKGAQQVKADFDQLTAAALAGQSAGLAQWSDDFNAAFNTDKFATTLCPAWFINNIKGNAGEDFKGWDIADVFPGGGGNWGGSYLVVPEQSKVKEEAAKLAAWLSAPEQQVAVFSAASNYPSSPTAQADPAVAGKVDAFLNDAPVGEIFKNRAAAVTVTPFKGAQYFDIQTKLADALNRVDVTKTQTPAQSWDQWLQDVAGLQ
ncbi:extracellular solute-binding protein [Xylanimonas protaetiae]|uniref:Extracellular solute-binding protein n=1 Tax=Xylanimonas protaetiae TaxID=2509457 RepID=A0A4V0YGM1_9MICO|nr:extracellular solute-binding protein [Xylanimonas protaetiae]